ncbi:hypothetical protein BGZ63DRAFT_389097 [Mariannaea sp. PMI_226]|nr:hypothetical protein BGZ63DRAFT_389097 [Mariannaea sp. PMI_226]
MAPTPPPGDSPASASGISHNYQQQSQDKIRRNVACISCRDSKVRCRANSVPGQPCQRCAKLQLSCVYDRSHKRVTRKSKLELLEQELKSIKQAVNPRSKGEPPWSPPTPQVSNHNFPEQAKRLDYSGPNPVIAASLLPPQPQPPPSQTNQAIGPTKSRVLDDILISGEDIDWYFEKYLECFHPYLPVLRKKTPNECYEASPILFWAVTYVACRRYARNDAIYSSLHELLQRDIWTVLSNPVHDVETIHTLLLLCAWPFSTIRFVADPSSTLILAALNACLLLGMHTGRGSHPRYCIGGRLNMHFTDQEASTTWMFCCILSQRISACAGVPPMLLQHNDAQCKRVMENILAPELVLMFDLQKFSNRLHTAMAAQVADHGGVTESTTKIWEDEFELLRALSGRLDNDCSRFLLLVAQLEVQSYYFASPAGASRPNFALNALRTFNTAHAVVTSALALESHSKFLSHGPHWIYRAVIDASCIILSTLHSTGAPANLSPADADAIVLQIRTAVSGCSVREGDLPGRAVLIIETFWSVRNMLPKFSEPASSWPERLGGSVTYFCLTRFREALQEAKKSAEGVNKGLEAFHGTPVDAPASADTDQPVNNPDLFQELDWSMFLDEFGWGDGTLFLGPA